jgi:hypothetical protein
MSTGAGAVVTLNVTSAHFDGSVYRISLSEAVGGYSQDTWVGYSEDCLNVQGGTGCPDANQPDPDPSTLLFSWGEKNDDQRNSVLRVNFGAGVDFTLDTISFRTPTTVGGDPIDLLGPTAGPNSARFQYPTGTVDPNRVQGAGTMVVYEKNLEVWRGAEIPGIPPFIPPTSIPPHYVTDQRMGITAYDSGTSIATVDNWVVPIDQSLAGVRTDDTDFHVVDPSTGGEGVQEYLIDQTYFFTDTNDASGTKDQTLVFDDGDRLEFRFYEEQNRWDGEGAAGEPGRPDAYYGNFEIIITPLDTPESTLTVTANQILTDLRAGDTATSTGSLSASNQGDVGSELSGSFAALTGATDQIVADDDPNPPGTALAFGPLARGESAQRDYTFSAGAVAFDASDAGSTGEVFTVTQSVTSDADTDPNQSRTLTGTVKGPILGVSELSAPDSTDPADWIAYNIVDDVDGTTGEGSTINLGTIEVGDDFLLKELTLANLFGADEGLLSLLTFYNVGVVNLNGAFFSLDSGPAGGDTLQVGDPNLSVTIRFDPEDTDIGTWTGRLNFSTDQNRAQDICGGSSSCTDAFDLSFNLRATLTPAPAPVPGVLALIALGALPLVMIAPKRRTRL